MKIVLWDRNIHVDRIMTMGEGFGDALRTVRYRVFTRHETRLGDGGFRLTRAKGRK